MTDTPTPDKKTPRKRNWPIRHFARLLDEFLETLTEKDGESPKTIEGLQIEVNKALLDHFKRPQ